MSGIDAFRKGIAHNFSGAQVLNDVQIEPALSGRSVDKIAHPGLDLAGRRRTFVAEGSAQRVTVLGVGGDFVGLVSPRDAPGKP